MEIVRLLSSFGVPNREIGLTLREYGCSMTGKIAKQTFTQKMAPLWKFIYFDVISEARNKNKLELVEQWMQTDQLSLSFKLEEQQTQVLGKRETQERLREASHQ